MDTLLEKVKANLILEHSADDALLQNYITAAVSYAESYQHIQEGYYTENAMPATTEQAVIMLASHFYESRDGSTGGFFADNTNAAQQVWNTVNLLLRLDRAGLEHGQPSASARPKLVRLAPVGSPESRLAFWGEEEQRNERTFRACTETSDMEFVTTRKV